MIRGWMDVVDGLCNAQWLSIGEGLYIHMLLHIMT